MRKRTTGKHNRGTPTAGWREHRTHYVIIVHEVKKAIGDEELRADLETCLSAGWRASLHAIGDRAIEQIVDHAAFHRSEPCAF